MNKRTTVQGWDIYIDTHKEMVLFSLNGDKITPDGIDQLSRDFEKLSGYKVVVIQSINSVQYTDIERLLKKDDVNE